MNEQHQQPAQDAMSIQNVFDLLEHRAYDDAVARLLGETLPLRFVDEPKKGFFARMFGG